MAGDPNAVGPRTGPIIHVPADTLDHLVRSRGVERIDWLKIDVEGHEISVLEGGRAALSLTKRIILEVTESTEMECRRILEPVGFEVVAIEEGQPTRNLFLERTHA